MKKIKRIVCLFLTGVLCMGMGGMAVQAEEAWPSGISVASQCAIVMDADTGTILYQKNAKDICYPASITKIMTTMLALDHSKPDEVVTMSEDSIYKTEGSGVARDIGEQLSMKDCLYAVMLESANECAYAVAEHVGGGDYSKFIAMMNEKAKELGCENTHFNNCNGLPDEEHYTTCYDMALIAKEAIKNNDFRTLINTKNYILPKTNKKDQELPMYNHHAMICSNRTSRYLYEYAIGGKTGYTRAAGNTLVTYAEKDGMTLICVVMKSNSIAQYQDTRNLFDYCFENFKVYNVAQNETRYQNSTAEGGMMLTEVEPFASIDKTAQIILPKTAAFEDTKVEVSYDQAKGDVLGTLNYKYGDRTIGSANVVATKAEVKPYAFAQGGEKSDASSSPDASEKEKNKGKIDRTMIRNIAIIVVIAAAAALVGIWLFVNRHYLTRRRKRRHNRDPRYKTIKNNRRWHSKK